MAAWDSSSRQACTRTTARVRCGACSWTAAAGNGCSASRTAIKVFPIDSRFKFNPVIVEKGGTTEAIRTVFMRRSLDDWERAEYLATPYRRSQVEQFSPKSRAILEIQSRRDLEILEKIYANSVLLGDDGPDGWGIRYAREFRHDQRLAPVPAPSAVGSQGLPPRRVQPLAPRRLASHQGAVGRAGHRSHPDRNPQKSSLKTGCSTPPPAPNAAQAEARFVHGHLLKARRRSPHRLAHPMRPTPLRPSPSPPHGHTRGRHSFS